MSKAKPSGIALTEADAAVVKGMLLRGDRQHDIAAWFGVNGGRITDVNTGKTFASVNPEPPEVLPPPGPYRGERSAAAARTLAEQAVEEIEAIAARLKEKLAVIL